MQSGSERHCQQRLNAAARVVPKGRNRKTRINEDKKLTRQLDSTCETKCKYISSFVPQLIAKENGIFFFLLIYPC